MGDENKSVPSLLDIGIASLAVGPIAGILCFCGLEIFNWLNGTTIPEVVSAPMNVKTFLTVLLNVLKFGIDACSPIGFLIGIAHRNFFLHKNYKLLVGVFGFLGVNVPVLVLAVLTGGSNSYFGVETKHFFEAGLVFGISSVISGYIALGIIEYRMRARRNL